VGEAHPRGELRRILAAVREYDQLPFSGKRRLGEFPEESVRENLSSLLETCSLGSNRRADYFSPGPICIAARAPRRIGFPAIASRWGILPVDGGYVIKVARTRSLKGSP
jgi:hypothetical protein